ncbi:hypothetical protein HELRODRAFT_106963, partial [Helobdella robusta]|uniref:Sodium/hydrogen exchanger n=1 Tax=Helobdella robusta TaxID=6412 RepID=T1EE63_HELRO
MSAYKKFLVVIFLSGLILKCATSNQPAEHDSKAESSEKAPEKHGSNAAGGHEPAESGHGSAESGHGEAGEEEEHEERFQVAKFDFNYVKVPFIVGIWILYAVCAKLFFHWEKYLSRIFPESCLLIIIGVIFGVFLYLAGERMYEVNTTIFFLVLLPPIILDAGYYMPARAFFDQLGTILLYAILGTLLNNLLLGFALYGVYEGGGFQNFESPLLLLHALVLGSLLAAVDPVAVLAVFESVQVNEMLYIIVFGESLLNDGISVVLYHLFEGFSEIGIENIQGIDIIAGIASFFVIVFGATGIGMLLGLLAGFMSRFTKHQRKMEPLLVLVIGYLSFIIAEMFHLSGIISCTFCGITMRKYVEANYSEKSNKAIHVVLKMFAQASETIVFMYIGMSAVSDVHHWDTAFCILTLIFCLIFRTICVIVQTYFANMIRVVKLTKIDQFVMAYGGLRGAIAFALVLLLDPHGFPHRKMFITTTVLVIYFTNLAMGTTIEPLVKFLKVKRQQHRKPTIGEKIMNRFTDHVMGGFEDITGQSGHHQLRERFSTWNNNFLKPLIVGKSNPRTRGWQILSVYNQINQKAAKHHLQRSDHGKSLLFRDMSSLDLNRSPSSFNVGSTSSMANIPRGVIMQRKNWWESTASLSRTLHQDMMFRDKNEEANKIHHISEDIAGPILRVKAVHKQQNSLESDTVENSVIELN